MPRTRSTGWVIEIDHPDTGRTLRPAVLDDDPEITPSLNALAEIRIPVRKDPDWLTPALAGEGANPTMRVYKEGVRRPIEELARVEEQTDRTILVGEGGVELKQTAEREYDSERRPVAFKNLITSETTYGVDVDDPPITATETLVQNPDTTGELDALLSALSDPTVPLKVENGVVETTPVSWVAEAEDIQTDGGTFQADRFSDDFAAIFTDSQDRCVLNFTTEHTIPESEVGVILRIESTDVGPGLEVDLNGYRWQPLSDNGGSGALGWNEFAQNNYGTAELYAGGDLTEGDHICVIDAANTDPEGDDHKIDVVGVCDLRYVDPDTIDNDVNTAGGYLDGPRVHPIQNATFDSYVSPFSITGARVALSIDDTSGEQRIQFSNDRGSTWLPTDGSTDNTDTASLDFPSVGSTLALRVRLDAWEPSGPRNQTPRLNYASQTIDAYDLYGDVEQELLLINERYDKSIREIITDFAGDEQYLWSFNVADDGTFQVSWTQPGLRTAARDPSIGDVSVEKDLTTYSDVVITGSPQPVSGEPFTASTTFQSLVNDRLITGSESVYDPDTGTQFQRGSDYEIDYSDGQIRAVGTGDLVTTDTYEIDYQHEVRGSYNIASSNSNLTFKREISGVTSDRLASQIAWVLATKLSEPRHAATLQIPRPEVTFDVLEAFTLNNLDLPAEATPLEVREQPQLTPQGLAVRLGEVGQLEGELRDIAEQVRRVSGRA